MVESSEAYQGQLFLNPSLAPQVPTGAPRPFAPGEYVKNPNGSWSSEISVTVTDPQLNNGSPTVIPSLWLVDGRPVKVSEDQAVTYAISSQLQFPAFQSIGEAETFATNRESQWQTLQPADAGRVAPLWHPQKSSISAGATKVLNAAPPLNNSPAFRALEGR